MKRIYFVFFFILFFTISANAGLVTSVPDYIKSIGAENNELLQLGYLDVTLYGADPTGQKDSTAAIQNAVNDARKHQLVTFFPHQPNGDRGVYLVSDTIDCRMRSYSYYDYGMKSNVLIGSHKGNKRPLIKLKPNLKKFSDPSNPQPVFWFWSQAGHWEPEQYQYSDNPLDNDQDISFDQLFRGIDIDLGGNPGAIGIKNPGAQGQAIENVTINAIGAFAGLGNLAGLGAGEYDIEVIGGRYGIYIDTTKRTLSPYNGKVSLIGCTFRDQEKAVIKIVGKQATPILFAGFLIENKNDVPFNIGTINSLNSGGFTLVDGVVDINGGYFISRENKGLYIRDVYFRGIDTIVDNWKISDKSNWTHVKEYSANSQKFINLVDGSLNNSIYKLKEEGLTYNKTQLVYSLVKNIHQWNENSFPTFEDSEVVNIKQLGAKGDGVTDDTTIILKAIDKHEKIFFPRGIYTVSSTITLKANTKLFGVSKTNTIIIPNGSWKPTSEAIILSTENSKEGTAILADLLIANHGTDLHKNDSLDSFYHAKTNTTQYDQFRFTPIEWRVGRNSILRDVISGMYGAYVSKDEQRCDYHRFRVNGFGGGKWFSVLGRWLGAQSSDSRGMLIENTDEPMYIHPINFAVDPRNINIEISNSKNKYFYFPSFEGSKTIFRISNSKNIAIFTSSKNNIPSYSSDRAIVEVFDCNNIVISMVNSRSDLIKNEYHLIENFHDAYFRIQSNNIGLFKRNDIDFQIITSMPSPILKIKN